jgi:hypothetical protein
MRFVNDKDQFLVALKGYSITQPIHSAEKFPIFQKWLDVWKEGTKVYLQYLFYVDAFVTLKLYV